MFINLLFLTFRKISSTNNPHQIEHPLGCSIIFPNIPTKFWRTLPSRIVSNSGRIFSKLTHRKLPATRRKGEKHDTIIRRIPNRGLPRSRRLPWQLARGDRPPAAP